MAKFQCTLLDYNQNDKPFPHTIEAHELRIEDGCLLFYDFHLRLLLAVAQGRWVDVIQE